MGRSKAEPVVLPRGGSFALDHTAKLILDALAARNWDVPGIRVATKIWDPGEIDGMPLGGTYHRYVDNISIPGEDFRLWFVHQGLPKNHFRALRRVVIPHWALDIDYATYPTLFNYYGDNWYDDHVIFCSGRIFQDVVADRHMFSRRALRYAGSAETERIIIPDVHSINDKTLAKSTYLVADTKYGKLGTAPAFYETANMLEQFNVWMGVKLLERIKLIR